MQDGERLDRRGKAMKLESTFSTTKQGRLSRKSVSRRRCLTLGEGDSLLTRTDRCKVWATNHSTWAPRAAAGPEFEEKSISCEHRYSAHNISQSGPWLFTCWAFLKTGTMRGRIIIESAWLPGTWRSAPVKPCHTHVSINQAKGNCLMQTIMNTSLSKGQIKLIIDPVCCLQARMWAI